MQIRNSYPRGWRYLLLLVALFTAFASSPFGTASAASSLPASQITYSSYSSALAAPVAQSAESFPVPAPSEVSEGRARYFSQTAHFLRGIFLEYWETHGATPVLGLPITEAFVEDGLAVQYLERARLEWHPDISRDPSRQVLLTRLGAVMTEARGLSFNSLPGGSATPNSFFFSETGHNLSNAFLTYWQSNGGLAVFGYPISEEIVERNDADGQEYTVQYFERNRFEWHPERSSINNVQLGLLGVEYARSQSLNPLARILLPGPFPGSQEDLTASPELERLVEAELLEPVRALGRSDQFRWVPALIIEYEITLSIEEIEDEDVGGIFIATRGSNRSVRYQIIIPEMRRSASPASLASVIAHEATHAYDATTGALATRSNCSIDGEVRAFMNGLAAWVLLNGKGSLSPGYEPDSFDRVINSSLRSFNGGSESLLFDFDVNAARDHVRRAYGPDCES